MDMSDKIQAVYDTASECGGEVRKDYSGRGMMGETCYGIVTDNYDLCIESAIKNGLTRARTDSMGRDTIVYWENIHEED